MIKVTDALTTNHGQWRLLGINPNGKMDPSSLWKRGLKREREKLTDKLLSG
jgi:hypothetical protein